MVVAGEGVFGGDGVTRMRPRLRCGKEGSSRTLEGPGARRGIDRTEPVGVEGVRFRRLHPLFLTAFSHPSKQGRPSPKFV